ncbi:hypothetical protein HKI87_13g74650 [Chloropicon roscoffensis]|uniref:Uncharacterized protein n=2 Tax=Chloropicon roscoffensis TaxID=1461544 RepID=A0AAX4PI18_9CHLO
MGGDEEEEKKRLGEPEGMEVQAEAAPVFPPPPVVWYECGTCGKNVRIKNDIMSGKTCDEPMCDNQMCKGRMLFKKRTRKVQMHLAR